MIIVLYGAMISYCLLRIRFIQLKNLVVYEIDSRPADVAARETFARINFSLFVYSPGLHYKTRTLL